VPSLRKLQKEHAKDAFVILGVSSDKDRKTWSAFTEKNGMVWPQYWDENKKMQQVFGVRLFPTYVLLDRDGIERLRVSGSGYHESKVLAETIEQQLKMAGKYGALAVGLPRRCLIHRAVARRSALSDRPTCSNVTRLTRAPASAPWLQRLQPGVLHLVVAEHPLHEQDESIARSWSGRRLAHRARR
jgi:hypothetical protein